MLSAPRHQVKRGAPLLVRRESYLVPAVGLRHSADAGHGSGVSAQVHRVTAPTPLPRAHPSADERGSGASEQTSTVTRPG